MKITKLLVRGEKLSANNSHIVARAESQLALAFIKCGFQCDTIDLTKKIGNRMNQFRIVPKIRKYNLVRYDNGKTKRTRTPTWAERVEFNDIVNLVFDQHGLSAKIVSGIFLIRCPVTGVKTEDDWLEQEQQADAWARGGSSGQTFTGVGSVYSTLTKME